MNLKADFALGEYESSVEAAWQKMKGQKIMERIWSRDHTVWKEEPKEISNRLGWLTAPAWTLDKLPKIEDFTNSVRQEGFKRVLLLGMGGSTLAPEVIARVFGVKASYLPLRVLDTTDPTSILRETEELKKEKTLIIVSSKSGSTVESDALMKYFYHLLVSQMGKENAARHMVIITDPGSPLAELGNRLKFRQVFLNDPDIGGRFSALSLVGMVPAHLLGVECREMLLYAHQFAAEEKEKGEGALCARLGIAIGELARTGRDKLTLFISPSLQGFGDWLEQLLAESTGKEGKGILPIIENEPLPPEYYGKDRVFVSIAKTGEIIHPFPGFPAIGLKFNDLLDLGALFFLWELTTAVCAYRLSVNPFDQPDVERAKRAAREVLSQMVEEKPSFFVNDIEVFGLSSIHNLRDVFDEIDENISYVAIQAYLTCDDEVQKALDLLKKALMHRFRRPVTVGIGPRYLHSTGQLHKGDGGRGFFLQLTQPVLEDVPIPESMENSHSTLTFGTLRAAQARGDREALVSLGRKVVRLHLYPPVVDKLTYLCQLL